MGPSPAPPDGAEGPGERLEFADGLEFVAGGPSRPVGRGASRIGLALRHVAQTWPGRVVRFVSDGRATGGARDALEGARAVASRGGRVFTSPPAVPAADVALLEARATAGGEGVRVVASLASSTSGSVRVTLREGGRTASEKVLVVRPGDRFEVSLDDPEPARRAALGGSYEVRLEPSASTPDDDPANDRLAVPVRGAARTVLVWGGLAPSLLASPEDALAVRGVAYPSRTDLAWADVVVLSSVPWATIGRSGTDALARFVAGGGRLLLLGGPASYAAGGWNGTPLEERLSPLRVPREDADSLVLVLALDRSGSTAGGTLDALAHAVGRVAEGLARGERLGVLPFARTPASELLEPGFVSGPDEARTRTLVASVRALTPHGGTDLVRAVREAARWAASGPPARERRVLLLTDGDPDAPPTVEELRVVRSELEAQGVRFGALVQGDPKAADLLREGLAERSEDVVLLAETAGFPAALLHALADVRRDRDVLFSPDEVVNLAGGDLALPGGYRPERIHRLEVSEGSRVFAEAVWTRAPEHDPPRTALGAQRPHGAGRVVALAFGPQGEAEGAAATAWIRPLIARLAAEADRGLAADFAGDRGGDLVVRAPSAAGAGRLRVGGEDPADPVELTEVEPGLFRGPAPAGAEPWLVRGAAGSVRDLAGRPLDLPARAADEHRGAGVDEDMLRALAEAGGGRRLAAGERPPRGPAQAGAPLAPWLLLLAVALLLADRALARDPSRGGVP